MVLQELGSQITGALSKLNNAPVIDQQVLNDILKEIAGALLSADVNVRIVQTLRTNVLKLCDLEKLSNTGANKSRVIRKAVFDELVRLLTPEKQAFQPKKGQSNVFMFVGLQGAGKTTSIAKYANYWSRKGWKTCMVCADTFRAGAFDQLKQNATRIRVPFYGSYTEPDPVKIAEEGVEQFRSEGYEIIIVDTSGRHKQESDLFEEMEQVQAAVDPDEVVFVMDSTIGQAVSEQANAFKESVPVGSVMITKLDGHAKGGGALSAVTQTNSPITFICTGEHFDEFEKFEPQSFVSRLLGMGDMKGLFETFKERTDIFEKAPQMMERMQKGVFTLRDMREQFQSVMKMGNLSQLMTMIPGMSNLMPAGSEREGANRIQMFMTTMDSMTEDELDGIFKQRVKDKNGKWTFTYEKQISEQRLRRVSRGSGVDINVVKAMMQCHKQFEKMVQKMGKTGLMKGGDAGMAQQMQRNPAAMMQQLQRSMDPRMMQQMGGTDNMMKMMKEMGKMDMSEMMKMAGMAGMGGMGGMGGGGGGGRRGRRR